MVATVREELMVATVREIDGGDSGEESIAATARWNTRKSRVFDHTHARFNVSNTVKAKLILKYNFLNKLGSDFGGR
jgi:hypothetical protein